MNGLTISQYVHLTWPTGTSSDRVDVDDDTGLTSKWVCTCICIHIEATQIEYRYSVSFKQFKATQIEYISRWKKEKVQSKLLRILQLRPQVAAAAKLPAVGLPFQCLVKQERLKHQLQSGEVTTRRGLPMFPLSVLRDFWGRHSTKLFNPALASTSDSWATSCGKRSVESTRGKLGSWTEGFATKWEYYRLLRIAYYSKNDQHSWRHWNKNAAVLFCALFFLFLLLFLLIFLVFRLPYVVPSSATSSGQLDVLLASWVL